MSTPAGRPFARPDFLDYAPKRVRDTMGPRFVDSPGDPIPIAPRAPAPDQPESNDEERENVPLVPDDPQDEGAHRHASSDESSDDEVPYDESPYDDVDAEADRDRDEAAYDDFPYDEEATLEDLDEQRAHIRAHVGADDRSDDGSHAEGEPGEHTDELARLVTMLKSIRRNGDAAAPARRAGVLPPLGSAYDSDLVIDGLRVPPSLRPSHVPPPRQHPSGSGGFTLVLGVALACLVAAGLAWFVAGSWRPSVLPTAARSVDEQARDSAPADQPVMPMAERGSRLATVPAATYAVAAAEPPAADAPPPVDQQPSGPTPGPRVVPLVRVPAWPSDAQGGGAPPAAAPSMASLPPAAAPQSGPPPEPPAPPPEPAMNAQEIDLLINQGKQFIAVGDLATARTVLQRAADAGVAPAALALGETYDPAVLARQGVRGINGDVAQARRWYTRAQALGSTEAANRLAAMAQP